MMEVPWLSHLIIFIMVSHFGVETSSPCPANQFLHPHGICCEFCGIGTFMLKPCQVHGSNPLCAPCKMGISYMDKNNNMTMCKQCSVCDPESEVEERECDIEFNRLCVCREGFHSKGNKCRMEESTRGEIDFPSNDLPSRWIWLPLVIGLLLMLVIFIWGRRLLHLKVRRSFFVSKIVSCFTNNATNPANSDYVERDISLTPFIPHSRSSGVLPTECESRTSMEPRILKTSYGRTPSLDLNSANPRIMISHDLRTAIRTGTDQLYPEHPDRFDFYAQVVSSESFSSGRHYWEVDVKSSDWCRIGICLNSMGRKGKLEECALGRNPKSWCIEKCKKTYSAMHNKQLTDLSVSGHLERFGFFLDCEEGELTCFGDSRALHIFRGNFMDPVKPAIGICEVGYSTQFCSF